jgi:F-type H+-transporting ATPase subunit epsilon
MSLTLTILTPQRKLVEKEPVTELFAPGFKGQLDILPNHADFVTELETGTLRWASASGGWKTASISTGLLEIHSQNVTVLAEVSELGTDVDLPRAQAARERAAKLLEVGGLDDGDLKKQELKLKRAIARIGASTGA